MLNVKPTFIILCLAVAVASLDQFKSPKEMAKCIETCEAPISACLKEMESACAKAYTHCHSQKNFITCIESANGIMMQNIAKCMRKDCKPIQEVETPKKITGSERGREFRKFKQVTDNDNSGDSADDIQGGSSNQKVLSDPQNSNKNKGNRR